MKITHYAVSATCNNLLDITVLLLYFFCNLTNTGKYYTGPLYTLFAPCVSVPTILPLCMYMHTLRWIHMFSLIRTKQSNLSIVFCVCQSTRISGYCRLCKHFTGFCFQQWGHVMSCHPLLQNPGYAPDLAGTNPPSTRSAIMLLYTR